MSSRNLKVDYKGRIFYETGSFGREYVFPSFSDIKTLDSTISHQLGNEDQNVLIRINNSSNVTVDIPNQSQAAVPVGASFMVSKIGTGDVLFSPNSNVTLNSSGTTLSTQYGAISVVKVKKNEWDAYGTLS